MTRWLGNVTNHWRCGVDEGHSLTETEANFSCVVFFQSQAWGFSIDYNNFYLSINGNRANGSNARIRTGSGQTADIGLLRHNVTVARTHSDQSIYIEGQFNNTSGYMNGTSTAGGWVTVPKKSNWAISYNANGGSGAPASQTKWYGENLTLQTARPTRTGHNFLYWTTDFGSGAVRFDPGGNYTYNQGATLYANWQPHTYTVSYNANGGSGAPGNQTKTYGQNLTLSSARPTRQNYNFKGWATSSTGGVAYQPGGTYTGNAGVTLYAVWELAWLEPRITNLQASRCDSAGSLNEEGQYAKVTFNWATDRTVSSIKISCNGVTTDASGSGTSGSVSVVVGANALSTESQYTVRVTVTDAVGSAWSETVIAPMNYIMDIAPNGSVAFGKPANQNSRGVEISKNVQLKIFGPVYGFQAQGYFNDGAWHYKLMAKSIKDINDLGLSGAMRIVGHAGGYGSDPIDVSVPVRGASATTVTINSGIETAWNNSNAATIMLVIGSDNYLYAYIAAAGYYAYNIRFEGHGFITVETDWSTGRTLGTVIFDSGVLKTDQFGGYPAKYEYLNGFPGFALPNKTRSEWIRTTYNGLIPYQSGGASALGTESWPFNSAYINNLHVRNNNLYWDNTGGLKGRVMKLIWRGTLSIDGSITSSEMQYYNVFVLDTGDRRLVGARHPNNKYIDFQYHGINDTGNIITMNNAKLYFDSDTKLRFINSVHYAPYTGWITTGMDIKALYGLL